MPEPVLILDVPFLAHRSMHVMKGLQFDGSPTSVVFGLMRDLIGWQELFRTRRIVFCFDWGRNKRLELYPEYKQNRRSREFSKEERKRWGILKKQIVRLAEEDLFRLGFRNVLFEDGFEADDLVASVVLSSLSEGDEAVVVASDADLYQLIAPNVMMYNPVGNKRKTYQWFCQEHGIQPNQWADVKAIAGCSGDNVKGLEGVGEKSVVAYLKGELVKGKKYEAISKCADLWKENLRLVRLPFEGTPVFELREDKVTRERWECFCGKYGIKSLRGLYPGR
jgi:DNA polymerase-1